MTLRPSKATSVYLFAILAYKLVHQKQAWDSIHISLIESVRNGQRPVISPNVDTWLSNLIRECWLENPYDRPTAASVSCILEDYLTQPNDTVVTPCSITLESSLTNYHDFDVTIISSPYSPHSDTLAEVYEGNTSHRTYRGNHK